MDQSAAATGANDTRNRIRHNREPHAARFALGGRRPRRDLRLWAQPWSSIGQGGYAGFLSNPPEKVRP